MLYFTWQYITKVVWLQPKSYKHGELDYLGGIGWKIFRYLGIPFESYK